MTQNAPALFLGPGSPMNAPGDSPSAQGWRALAQRFQRPRAIGAAREGERALSFNRHFFPGLSMTSTAFAIAPS
jgi:hypothetical protein